MSNKNTKGSSFSDEKRAQMWKEIDAALDSDNELDVDAYLESHGINIQPADTVNRQTKLLINHTFSDVDVSKEKFQGKYKILKQIDSGGQSDVFLAERSDGVYQQTVVIKFISQRFGQKILKQQFLREMQLLADLRHPGVVVIIDGNVTADGQPWLVLDYIEGPHIDDFCVNNRSTIQSVVSLMLNLCDTLQFIHQRGVLHKDLKPSNVMVKQINGVPHPVLIDFGIAMIADDEVDLNFGTHGFSAPEQVAGGKVDQRSDLFSLGALCGYLLLKTQGQNIDITDPNVMFNALRRSSIPIDLQKVIFKLTEPEKLKRYQNVNAVRSDFNQWLLGFPLSFDNHRVSAVFKKSIKRHPWVTLAILIVLVSAVWFTGKYTRDIQQLQQLTVAEKNATDELMNFMLDDLYENLNRIGRVDVLLTVAEKSVSHLSKQDPLTLDQTGHFQTAKAYINTGRVFDYLEKSDRAQEMFNAARTHLEQNRHDQANEREYLELLAKLGVYESFVLSSAGQERATSRVLLGAVETMQQLSKKYLDYDLHMLWRARLQLSYHYMEYAQTELATEQVNKTVQLAREQLQKNPNLVKWIWASSITMQMKAWYELDFGDLDQGIADIQSGITYARLSIEADPLDLKKHHNLRILHNQLAYFYLEAEMKDTAKIAVLKAIDLGNDLKLKAPFNLEFEREHAYSYTTAGEIFQKQGKLDIALNYFQKSTAITRQIYLQDSQNFSAANDLAVDYLLVADLLLQSGKRSEATELILKAEALMEPVIEAEPNNKYYIYALLVSKLHLEKLSEAKPLLEATRANGMVDNVIEELLTKHQLTDWLTEH